MFVLKVRLFPISFPVPMRSDQVQAVQTNMKRSLLVQYDKL